MAVAHIDDDKICRLAWLAKATLLATLAVIVWGAFVRASGSGAGCGSHWPTCNGEIVPHPKSFKTLVEVTHRITSGLDLLLVVALAFCSFRWLPKGHPGRAAGALSLFFMLTEAGVGAGIVLFEYVADNASVARATWMGVHLTNTFLLLAAIGASVTFARGDLPEKRGLRRWSDWLLLGLASALLLVGISGAIAALGDTLFPAASLTAGFAADASPTAHVLLRLRVLHPLFAVLTAALGLYAASRVHGESASPVVKRAALDLGVLVGVQVALGFLNLALLAPTAMQLLHLLAADLVWLALVRLALLARREPSPQPRERDLHRSESASPLSASPP
jgi:heme a synthase